MTARHSRYDTGICTDGAEPKHDLSSLMAPPPWTVDALCAQFPADMFFPEGQGSSARDAKAVCAMCPVTRQCLEYALAYERGAYGTDTSYAAQGVYGGLSPRQRMAIAAERRNNQEPAA